MISQFSARTCTHNAYRDFVLRHQNMRDYIGILNDAFDIIRSRCV